MLQKRTQLNQRHVGRLHTILNPVFEEATARLNAAHKEFVRIFELETREMIDSTEEGENISCPECSSEVHRGSFNFHRKARCPNKKQETLI